MPKSPRLYPPDRVITNTKTNESGVYNLPYLDSGPMKYVSPARLEGDSGNAAWCGPKNISRIDRTLELGSITESITVEAPPASTTGEHDVRRGSTPSSWRTFPLLWVAARVMQPR